MREIRLHGSEGGGIEINRSSLPLSRPLTATVRPSLEFAEQSATAAGLSSTTAVALARGVIYAMMISKLKILGGGHAGLRPGAGWYRDLCAAVRRDK